MSYCAKSLHFYKREVRANDTLARLGGDEFGLLLTQCPLSQAAKIAEQLKDLVHQFRFIWDSKTFIIGVSIGVVAINQHQQRFDGGYGGG